MIHEVIILLIAGFGAGVITGLLSASAVLFAAPVLIIFLGMSSYNAIGLSLAIDVFASLTATIVFYKNKNLDIKKSLLLLFTSLLFVIIGSFISTYIPHNNLTWVMGITTTFSGFSIYKRRNKEIKKLNEIKLLYVILSGAIIGLIAGTMGAGGGLMLLFVLVFFLRYDIHKAIGTSVLIMIFIALFGSVTHYYYSPFNIKYLFFTAIGGITGAYYSSLIANKLNKKQLAKVVGIIILTLGIALFVHTFL